MTEWPESEGRWLHSGRTEKERQESKARRWCVYRRIGRWLLLPVVLGPLVVWAIGVGLWVWLMEEPVRAVFDVAGKQPPGRGLVRTVVFRDSKTGCGMARRVVFVDELRAVIEARIDAVLGPSGENFHTRVRLETPGLGWVLNLLDEKEVR